MNLYVTGFRIMQLISTALRIYSYIFLADAILSWFLRPDSHLRRFLIFLTEPLVSLFRPLSQRMTRASRIPISFAHLFAYFFLLLLGRLVSALTVWMYF